MKAVEIKWDVDCEEELEQLPVEMDIPDGMNDSEEVSDYLSDETGFCHYGYRLIEKKSDDTISYYVTDDGTLKIFHGSKLLATVEDGKAEEDFVDDILYGMGYIWYEDGTIWETVYMPDEIELMKEVI